MLTILRRLARDRAATVSVEVALFVAVAAIVGIGAFVLADGVSNFFAAIGADYHDRADEVRAGIGGGT